MNKTAIKNYAIKARTKLIATVKVKARSIGVMENTVADVETVQGGFIYNGTTYSKDESWQRTRLIQHINLMSEDKGHTHGYNLVMEEAAYTWFNRLIALRFMEVNGYLPSNIRILSSEDKNRIEPDCIRFAHTLDFINQEKADGYKNNEELYRYILIKQCNALSAIMPKMFEEISDYSEILLPDKLYTNDNVIYDLVREIDEEDFKEQVEIIGWLYQYYISEKKDEVFKGLKNNIKITKDNVPAATQLFTPDWIVKYMVENSLGRLFVEKLGIDPDEFGWKYYLPEAEQTEEVKKQLEIINNEDGEFDIKKVKAIDPCMGSGHILVYLFDVYHAVYEHLGYAAREISSLILENNICGLDIDERATQLAYFALMMRARNHNRRFFRQKNIPQPNVCAMVESDAITREHLKLFDNHDVNYLYDLFKDAREYGSIIKLDREIDYNNLLTAIENIKVENTIFTEGFDNAKQTLKDIINIANILTVKYDAVVTNPPYMGGSGMSGKLSNYVKKHYKDSKNDLFSVFIERCGEMSKRHGLYGLIVQPSFLTLSAFEKCRRKVLSNNSFSSLLDMGRGIFGIDFGSTSFVFRNSNINNYAGNYFRLYKRIFQYINPEHIEQLFLKSKTNNCFTFDFDLYDTNAGITDAGINKQKIHYVSNQSNFKKMPGMPIVYWVSDKIYKAYDNNQQFRDIGNPRTGMMTANNSKYLRLWYEVNYCEFHNKKAYQNKWIKYLKGGPYRKWYGNLNYLLRYNNNPDYILQQKNAAVMDIETLEKIKCTWSDVTSGKNGFRIAPKDTFHDKSGHCFYPSKENQLWLLAYANTKVFQYILAIFNQTLHCQAGDVAKVVVPALKGTQKEYVSELSKNNINISQIDWDSYETSWDFIRHPLLNKRYESYKDYITPQNKTIIEECSNAYNVFANVHFNRLKSNEEALNKTFIEIFGVQDELTPKVEERHVSVTKIVDNLSKEDKKNRYTIEKSETIRSFISYAVGCMFGRYSLDIEGLMLAGQPFKDRYQQNPSFTGIDGRLTALEGDYIKDDSGEYHQCSFTPDSDNVLPITDNEYFEDDIVTRFVEFVKCAFDETQLEENLEFIASALYPNSSDIPQNSIRKYFNTSFYKDHVKIYKKKPIYWQFDSGKANGFKALVYLHRYDRLTVGRVRTDYLHQLQRMYQAEMQRIKMLDGMDSVSNREKAAFRKQSDSLQKKLEEISSYDQVIAHVANQNIELDLDDGVTENYKLFQEVEVTQGEGRSKLKMDLLSKI